MYQDFDAILPRFAHGDQIPRYIHQTFKSKSLPADLQVNVQHIKDLNPEWEYRIYDDADMLDFVRKNYGTILLSYLEKISPDYGAARADLFRYLLIYKMGGAYLDIKSSMTKPLSVVLVESDQYILSGWGHSANKARWGDHPDLQGIQDGELQQWHVIAAAGHPYLRAVICKVLRNIEDYRPWVHKVGRYGVLLLTGPIAYTQAIDPIRHLYSHRRIESGLAVGLTYTIYNDREHVSLFKTHYSQNHQSIVRLNGISGYLARAYSVLRAFKYKLYGGF